MLKPNKKDLKPSKITASGVIIIDVYLSIAIQFSIVFAAAMFSTTFFSNENELMNLVNKNLDRFSSNSFRFFILALIAILGLVSFIIVVLHQLKLIDDLNKVMSSIPRRICEEAVKYLIAMTSSVTGIGSSIVMFLYLNPNHADFAKINEFAFLTVYIFILGSGISCFFSVITKHREIEANLTNQKILEKTE